VVIYLRQVQLAANKLLYELVFSGPIIASSANLSFCTNHRYFTTANRAQWPRAAARLLGLRVRIPPRAWISASCECCQVEVSASGWSLGQRSPTECGVSECDREASIKRRPWPIRGCCAIGGGGGETRQKVSVSPKVNRICLVLVSRVGVVSSKRFLVHCLHLFKGLDFFPSPVT
jgi:hypothetical protein